VEVSGSVALVTGAAAGTRRAIAEALASQGAAVVVADTDARDGRRTVERIASRGGRAHFIEVDVTRSDDVHAMAAFAERELGGLQVLVNNAGGGGHIEPHFPDAGPPEWRTTLDLNLGGAMLATQLALDPMRRSGGGLVVNIASTAGLGFGPHPSPEYAAAKAGSSASPPRRPGCLSA
jgi:NAD(P)-dependent dehydrogenase (short-subunit alcohol dehydrogenase family)